MPHFGLLLLSTLLASTPASVASTSPTDSTRHPFLVFTGDGAPSSIESILEAMATVDVVYIGESHDDSVAHALESMFLQQAFARLAVGAEPQPQPRKRGRRDRRSDGRQSPRQVVLAMEMFERDAQLVLDEYLAGLIRERDFLAAARPWGNYASDYRAQVEFARIHKIPVVATNAPGRYVSRVGREGPQSLATLSKTARTFIAPLGFPPASNAYADRFRKAMQEMMAAAVKNAAKADSAAADSVHTPMPAAGPIHTPPQPADSIHAQPKAANSTDSPSPHGTRFTLDAQNLRDATMAYSIAQTLDTTPGALVLHVNGSFHSNFGLGTPEHTLRLRPKTRQLTIAILSEGYPEFDTETMTGAGDFVILTDPEVSGHERE